MTPEQFIDLLAEAGMLIEESPGVFGWKPTIEKAETFAKIVSDTERQACLALCKQHAEEYTTFYQHAAAGACEALAQAIKKRGK
jgi:hypothetical protein